MNIVDILVSELGLRKNQVVSAIDLIDQGNTIPFIARYRKDVTGEMTDIQLRDLNHRLEYLRNLDARKEDIKRFVIETLKPPTYLRNSINIEFSEYNSEWKITGKSADRDNPYSIMTYGTERANAYKLIEDALNFKDTRIFDYETDEK